MRGDREPASPSHMPIPSVLFQLRARGDQPIRHAPGRLVDCEAPWAMPSVASGWFRSRAASKRPVCLQVPRHMTNNPRIYLWIALALMVWLNYDAWQRDYGPRPDVVTTTTRPANGGPASTA